MSAFDVLEMQLREAAERSGASVPAAGVARRRQWRLPVVSFAVLMALGGGAFAADRVLDIGNPLTSEGGDPRPSATQGPGIVQDPTVKLLPIRVRDPFGGPPWAIRIFASNRGAQCVQVGQVYRGRFGVIRPDDSGQKIAFRPLPIRAGGTFSLCSGASADGFPVLRGQQKIEIRGGSQAPPTCGTKQAPAHCPITEVRSIRYGLLGPRARSATLSDQGGVRLASMTLTPQTGGAYLFVRRVPTHGYQVADAAQRVFDRRLRDAMARAAARAKARGLSPAETAAAFARARESFRRYLSGVVARTPRPPATRVRAAFEGAGSVWVAGPGRSSGALPGVPARSPVAPLTARAQVQASPARPGRQDFVTVSFRAPVAINAFDSSYRIRLAGPWRPPSCRFHRFGRAYSGSNRKMARGELVSFTQKPIGSPKRWCPGRYTARITLHSNGRDRFVGDAHFVVR